MCPQVVLIKYFGYMATSGQIDDLDIKKVRSNMLATGLLGVQNHLKYLFSELIVSYCKRATCGCRIRIEPTMSCDSNIIIH